MGDIRLSVNMSSQQLEQEAFLERFLANLDASGLAADRLKIEITENAIMRDMEVIVPKLRALRKDRHSDRDRRFRHGLLFVHVPQALPGEYAEDRSQFRRRHSCGFGDASIINAIVAMARGLKLDLIAEGVETRTQMRYLRFQGLPRSAGIHLQPTDSGA